jgi:cytochrome c556
MPFLLRSQSATPGTQGTGCESVQDIINIAATGEAFAVTILGEALASAGRGELPLSAEEIGMLTAARAAEQAHYEFLLESGAEASTLTFTLPAPALLTDVSTFWATVAELEESSVAAYLTAAQEFAAQGEAELAQVALQIGAVEAEHRVGARFYGILAGAFSGVPNDVAFERALFSSMADIPALLEELGFIGGSGAEMTYPGPGEIDTTGVQGLRP